MSGAAAVAPLLVADVAVRVRPRHVGRPRRGRRGGGDGVEAVDVLCALVEAAAGCGAEERNLVLDRLHAVLVVAEAVVRLLEAGRRARRRLPTQQLLLLLKHQTRTWRHWTRQTFVTDEKQDIERGLSNGSVTFESGAYQSSLPAP